MAARLSDCLVRDGTVTTEVVRAAIARQAVYGGALDTALLELAAVDEPTLWSALSKATGVPIPDAALFESPDPTAAGRFDATWSRRCRAVPVGMNGGVVQVCCGDPVDEAELAAARKALGISLELFVVPEVRLAAARQAVYGEVMPPRLLRVLARVMGAQPVRRWVRALAPEGTAPAKPAATAPGAGEGAEGLDAAEFDVPTNTFATGEVDILESRPSRGAPSPLLDAGREAAAAVARALAGDEGAVKEEASGAGSGSFAEQIQEKIDTSPGRAAALAGREAVPRTTSAHDREAAAKAAGADKSSPALVVVAPPTLATMTDEQEDQLCLVADDPTAGARLAALRVLRARLERPRVRQLADKLRESLWGPAELAVSAASALGELRDARAVPELIDVLGGPTAVAQTAARALLEIAQQDFGHSKKKWLAWWETHKKNERVDWLLEGLSHKSPEIRFSSSEELRQITGEYFGYHFDLPKREREEARERWQAWWYASGRARLPDRR